MHEPDPTKAGPSAVKHVDSRGITPIDIDPGPDPGSEDGGDLACWASLVCLGCGGVTTDPAHDLQHRRWLAALEKRPDGR